MLQRLLFDVAPTAEHDSTTLLAANPPPWSDQAFVVEWSTKMPA
jgi:hypothetical protein